MTLDLSVLTGMGIVATIHASSRELPVVDLCYATFLLSSTIEIFQSICFEHGKGHIRFSSRLFCGANTV